MGQFSLEVKFVRNIWHHCSYTYSGFNQLLCQCSEYSNFTFKSSTFRLERDCSNYVTNSGTPCRIRLPVSTARVGQEITLHITYLRPVDGGSMVPRYLAIHRHHTVTQNLDHSSTRHRCRTLNTSPVCYFGT